MNDSLARVEQLADLKDLVAGLRNLSLPALRRKLVDHGWKLEKYNRGIVIDLTASRVFFEGDSMADAVTNIPDQIDDEILSSRRIAASFEDTATKARQAVAKSKRGTRG